MTAIAAIDIGSNAMRLIIGQVNQNKRLDVIERSREPVRLGHDTFTTGLISKQSIERAVDALSLFRKSMEKHGVIHSKIVATSALREASNRDYFVAQIDELLKMKVAVIGAEEEARLIHLAVSNEVETQKKLALLIDIGGGSVEITLASNRQVLSTASFAIGTVRLMCLLKDKSRDENQFNQLVHEYVRSMRSHLKKEIGERKIDLCIGTGGNIESLGDLRKNLLGKDTDSVMAIDELNLLVRKLRNSSFDDRIQEMGLRPDRADVIVPAAIVLQRIVKQAGVTEIAVPHVGVREGLLIDMCADLYADKHRLNREQILTGARQLGRKYAYDEPHCDTVARFAAKLFDATQSLHELDEESRVLLETAAILHDIGHFINVSKHHKHSYYIIAATPILGLNETQMAIVANVARYHRMAFPSLRHEGYSALSPRNRGVTSKLAALLRIADAIDTEHESRVTGFSLEHTSSRCALRLEGEGDFLLEKWKVAKKSTLFEEVFNMKFSVD